MRPGARGGLQSQRAAQAPAVSRARTGSSPRPRSTPAAGSPAAATGRLPGRCRRRAGWSRGGSPLLRRLPRPGPGPLRLRGHPAPVVLVLAHRRGKAGRPIKVRSSCLAIPARQRHRPLRSHHPRRLDRRMAPAPHFLAAARAYRHLQEPRRRPPHRRHGPRQRRLRRRPVRPSAPLAAARRRPPGGGASRS